MGVHICDDELATFAADAPQVGHAAPVNYDDAGVERSWVNLVVEDDRHHPPWSVDLAKEEGTALALVAAALPQPIEQFCPEGRRYQKVRPPVE
jgi:hypothetical protein